MTSPSDRFSVVARPFDAVTVVERHPLTDARGFFERIFCTEAFASLGLAGPVVQINQSLTGTKGSIRGLHFQTPPFAETKVVSCLAGEIFDVAVDLRRGSSTFLQWHAEILSAENHRSMVIPPGFAHGFQALTDNCLMLYLHTAPHTPAAEAGLSALDPAIGIRWPLRVGALSPRDQAWPVSAGTFPGLSP